MIKCFHVQNYEGDHQEHIFAESRGKAIAQSEAYGWDGEFTKVQAVRKPEYDKYCSQGYVPKEVLLEDGWWFECCGRNEQGHRCCKQLTIEDNPIVVDDHVYCQNHAPLKGDSKDA